MTHGDGSSGGDGFPSRRRPLPLTVLCILGWAAIVLVVGRILWDRQLFGQLPAAHLIGTGIALAVGTATLVGYWLMRRWGVWLVAAGLAARLATGLVGWFPLRPEDVVWPGILLAAGLVYARRMR